MMIGQSPAFRRTLDLVRKLASCDAPVLIEGETGTGKELAARAVHYEGLRKALPFVPVNCGALPDSLLENELFGHARGAYTDARTEQAGLVQVAEGGTLFLDEVDALTPKAQVSLLRFLQDQRYRPLGSRSERSANVRIIAASNRSLDEQVEAGAFRSDLLYRLRLLHLPLPALREREGDIPLLAAHFAQLAARKFGGEERQLARATLDGFERYHWPGNVRELEYRVYQGFLLGEGSEILVTQPGARTGPLADEEPTNYRDAKDRAIAAFEATFLARAMRRADGNVTAAARLIGTERRHLGRLLKKYGIERPSA